MKRSTMGVAMALVITVAIGSAEAGNIPFKGSFSGTSVPTGSDTSAALPTIQNHETQ